MAAHPQAGFDEDRDSSRAGSVRAENRKETQSERKDDRRRPLRERGRQNRKSADPPRGEGEVLVKVQVALTCGTDLKVYQRGYHARMIVPPALFGHELAGVIEEVGAGVSGFKKGMRVVALNSAPCQMCFYCSKHQENLCEDLLFNNGAYAEYIRIPKRIVESNMLAIPTHVSFEEAAMVEPLACVLRGLHETGVEIGDTVTVIGGGPIGLMFVQVAKLWDAM